MGGVKAVRQTRAVPPMIVALWRRTLPPPDDCLQAPQSTILKPTRATLNSNGTGSALEWHYSALSHMPRMLFVSMELAIAVGCSFSRATLLPVHLLQPIC